MIKSVLPRLYVSAPLCYWDIYNAITTFQLDLLFHHFVKGLLPVCRWSLVDGSPGRYVRSVQCMVSICTVSRSIPVWCSTCLVFTVSGTVIQVYRIPLYWNKRWGARSRTYLYSDTDPLSVLARPQTLQVSSPQGKRYLQICLYVGDNVFSCSTKGGFPYYCSL